MENEKFVTVKQAAEIKGVSPITVNFWIRRGQLPAVKWGRDFVIDREDLAAVQRRPVGRPVGWRAKKDVEAV